MCSYNVWAHWEVAPPRAHLIGNWMSGSILVVFQLYMAHLACKLLFCLHRTLCVKHTEPSMCS